MQQILLVEDDPVVQAALVHALTDRGFAVEPLGTAMDALRAVADRVPDVVILDLGLPDLDGAVTLRMLRGVTNVPVIIATARGDERSVVALLNAGADDYVVKPFSSEQLVARITAVLRRTARQTVDESGVLEVGGLQIDLQQRVATLDGRDLELNRREFDLLAYLAARPNLVVSRRDLLHDVWLQRHVTDDQTIDVHVSWLRRKLGESAAHPRYLHTVRGVGLKLVSPG
ncbi:MAG TPA: response regulator transcription factor [Pseudonocardiaceae bacterium]|jgi:DNA-binding response OmpR family regulator|nr:response regulator transcription factor [Pseudonocardiaceae bacterium]